MEAKLPIVKLVIIGAIIFFTNSTFATDFTTNSASQVNERSPFKINVTPRKTRVHVGEPFKVALEVKNISNTNQQFKVWSCSWYENWRSSNPAIGWEGWACQQNGPMEVKLAPEESFKETLAGKEMEMRVLQPVLTNKISFQMVFHTGTNIHVYRPGEIIPDDEKGKIYHSNEVTIDVISN